MDCSTDDYEMQSVLVTFEYTNILIFLRIPCLLLTAIDYITSLYPLTLTIYFLQQTLIKLQQSGEVNDERHNPPTLKYYKHNNNNNNNIANINTTNSVTNNTNIISNDSDAALMAPIELVILFAEKYFDRFDSLSLLQIIPPSTSITLISKYLELVMEYGIVKKRNLQVCVDDSCYDADALMMMICMIISMVISMSFYILSFVHR